MGASQEAYSSGCSRKGQGANGEAFYGSLTIKFTGIASPGWSQPSAIPASAQTAKSLTEAVRLSEELGLLEVTPVLAISPNLRPSMRTIDAIVLIVADKLLDVWVR